MFIIYNGEVVLQKEWSITVFQRLYYLIDNVEYVLHVINFFFFSNFNFFL